MPYTDEGVFYHDRRVDAVNDPYSRAGENLALHVETFLFDEKAPGFMRYEFLAWALAHFDATKNSSGNIVHGLTWDPDDHDAIAALSADPVKVGSRDLDRAIRYPADAKASPHVDTDVPAAPDADEDNEPIDAVHDDFHADNLSGDVAPDVDPPVEA